MRGSTVPRVVDVTSPGQDAPPRRAPGVRLERSCGEALLLSSDGRRLCTANDSAVALWELCDGRTTVEEMVTAVLLISGAEPEVVKHEVVLALTALEEADAIVWHRATW